MTSNTGFNRGPSIGFQEGGAQRDVNAPLKGIFSPEFLDRLDEVIAFETFDKKGILHITNQMLEEIRQELANRDIQVTFANEVAPFLVEKMPLGESARPLRAVVRDHIEDPLSLELLSGGSADPVIVTVEDDQVVFARPVPVI
jgi:ATP-dependent Clp protease ATP-binding subunit ClpC